MNQPGDDKEFQAYLDGDSAESRHYADLGAEEPPPEVDARILAEAERAVKVERPSDHRAPPFKSFAWAAVVVLSFSLVLNILFREPVVDEIPTVGMPAGRPVEPGPPESLEMRREAEPEAKRSDDAGGPGPRKLEPLTASARVAEQREPESATAGRADSPAEEADLSGAMADLAAANDTGPGDRALRVVADYAGATRTAPSKAAPDRPGPASPANEEAEAMLAHVLELHEAGDDDAALAVLAEFRERHPDHPVSRELAELGL